MRYRCILTIIAAALLSTASYGFQSGQDDIEYMVLLDQLNTLLATVAGWERQANILLTLTIVVAILGLVVSAMQKSRKASGRLVTAIVGMMISALTVITNTAFTTDCWTLKRNAIQSRVKIRQVEAQLAGFHTADPKDRQVYKENVIQLINEIGGREEQMLKAEITLDVVPSVYADSGQPPWITRTPEDRFNLYFVGMATDVLLTKARDDSYRNALEAALKQLALQTNLRAGPAEMEPVRKYLLGAAAVADTYFSYESGSRLYRHYSLLKLSRTLARPDVIKAIIRP